LKYLFKRFSKTDLKSFIALSRKVYSVSNPVTNSDHIHWKHLKAPFGPSFIFGLIDGKKLVGRLMVQPTRFWIKEKKTTIHILADLVLMKEYRNPVSNFIDLISLQNKEMRSKLILHTGNENSIPLYTKLLNYYKAFDLSTFCFVKNLFKILGEKFNLKSLYFFDFLLSPIKYAFIIIAKFLLSLCQLRFIIDKIVSENEISQLISANKKNEIFIDRSESFLRWRYGIYNKKKVTYIKIYRKDVFIGYFVIVEKMFTNLKLFIIHDFMLNPLSSKFDFLFIKFYLLHRFLKSSNDILIAMANAKSLIGNKISGFPFFKVSDNFLPHSSPFFIRNSKFRSFESMHLTLADIDYF
jgi:hypothetical protein